MVFGVLGPACICFLRGTPAAAACPNHISEHAPQTPHHPALCRYCLLERCLAHAEPALLVGETGTGKTTVCQMAAFVRGRRLHIINCNQHTEVSDFLGGFRPNRCGGAGCPEAAAAKPLLASQSVLVRRSSRRTDLELTGVAPTSANRFLRRHRERSLLQLQAAVAAFNASPLLAALSLPRLPAAPAPSPAALQALLAEARSALSVVQKHAGQHGGEGEAAQQAAQLGEAVEALTAAVAGVRAPFEWVDGPLVEAMKQGDVILIDELNLAEDAVLERLNR